MPKFNQGFGLGLEGVFSTGGGGAPVVPFALSQLPAGSYREADSRTSVTADGSNRVSAWGAKVGSGGFATAVSAEMPTLVADAWSPGIPLIVGNGASSGNILRDTASPIPKFEKLWTFLVAKRANADQQSTGTYKNIFATGRLSDNLQYSLIMQRTTADAAQDKVYLLAGSGSPLAMDGFPKDGKAVIWTRHDGLKYNVNVNGGLSSDGTAPAGARTGTWVFGTDDAITSRAAIGIVELDFVDPAALPGGEEQVANGYIIEGYLHWKYGTQALLKARKPTHPFADRPPYATDYSGFNRLIVAYGNSLSAGTYNQMAGTALYDAAARGLTVTNFAVSGYKPEDIRAAFIGAAAAQHKKIVCVGDGWKNASLNGTSFDNVLNLDIVPTVEAAHGLGAGNAHMVITGEWVGFISGGGANGTALGDPGRATIDAHNAAIQAAYPNYYFDLFNALVALGAPTGPYPDAVAYAKGWIPDVLRDGSTLHLSVLGYQVAAALVAAFIRTKGWDL